MVEPVRSTAYLGPDKGRWAPSSWTDIVEAAAGGLIDESHWVDLKQELPTGKRTVNTELAQDLASLAIDGGLLIIGIEDRHSYAGKVCGVDLAKLADRVDQVARDKVRPPLVVRSIEVPDPDNAGRGCLLVHVPPSAQAPHMVDYVYYGRGDRANIRLSDEQVRSILADRARDRGDVITELRRMADDDPLPTEERKNGHIYLLAQPETAPDEAFVDFLARSDSLQVVNELLDQIDRDAERATFAPALRQLHHRITRAEGRAFTTVSPGDSIYEPGLLELVVRDDGGIRLICGRGTDQHGFANLPDTEPPRVMFGVIVLGLARRLVAFAGQLGEQQAAYQGHWRLGIRLDRLHGAWPAERFAGGFLDHFDPYQREVYERVSSASTEELINSPQAVAQRLVAPLFRGFGIAERYS